MNIQQTDDLSNAYALLEEGKPLQAREILDRALEYNFGNAELIFARWCCSYWTDFVQTLAKLDSTERGDSLVARWKAFKIDYERQKQIFQKPLYAIQKGIFRLALDSYESFHEEGNQLQQAELLRKKGLCCKKLGKYEDALNLLTEAHRISMSSAVIISEMADCFALCGEDKKAKVLFREAFFIDAQKIELQFLDSDLIASLINRIKEKGYSGSELQAWIPVYGVLYGVFNVKRELRTQEVGRLKQEIYALENEIKDPASDSKILTPKLINMYFWLIDHYARTNEGNEKINTCLLQIRVHDENIYRMYTK